MTDQPLISIITPFLNVENFISETINSVLAQTYDHWELILVDDGSTDGSSQIAQRYAIQHAAKIRYFDHDQHRNRGPSPSRNTGRQHANGSLIAYLDADDVWLPRKLEQQVAILRDNPDAGMIIGATQYWHSWTRRPEDVGRDAVTPVGAPQNMLVRPPKLLNFLYPLGTGAAPSINTVLVRASAIDRAGGWEDKFPSFYDDQAVLTKLYLQTPIYVASTCWDRYRQRDASVMHKAKAEGRYHSVRGEFLEWFEDYLDGEKCAHPPVREALRRALWTYRHPILRRMGRFGGRLLRTLTQPAGWKRWPNKSPAGPPYAPR